MTCDEFAGWLSYRRMHGPLDPMARLDNAFAFIARRFFGGKLEDFLMWEKKEQDGSLESVAKLLGARPAAVKNHG